MSNALDIYTLHQGYLESYKDTVALEEESVIDEVVSALVLALIRMGYERLGDVPKRRLNAFLAEFTKSISKELDAQQDDILEIVKRFISVENRLLSRIVTRTTSEIAIANTKSLVGMVMNSDIANAGVTIAALFKLTSADVIARLRQQVKIAAANNMTLQELINSLVGTKSNNYRDGVVSTLKRKLHTNINSAFQHAAGIISYELMRRVSDKYTWIAILDSRTTQICRSRNGQVYTFGEGPRPPAHWNCRSFIVPVSVVVLSELPTYYTFLKRQPAWVQDDFLGPARGRELRKGKIKANDIPGFDNTRPLTLTEYNEKLTKLTKEVA